MLHRSSSFKGLHLFLYTVFTWEAFSDWPVHTFQTPHVFHMDLSCMLRSLHPQIPMQLWPIREPPTQLHTQKPFPWTKMKIRNYFLLTGGTDRFGLTEIPQWGKQQPPRDILGQENGVSKWGFTLFSPWTMIPVWIRALWTWAQSSQRGTPDPRTIQNPRGSCVFTTWTL